MSVARSAALCSGPPNVLVAAWTRLVRCLGPCAIAACLCALPGLAAHAQAVGPHVQALTSGWQIRLAEGDPAALAQPAAAQWHPAAVPGSVHTDLLAAGLIDEPYRGDNESRLQWIGLADWEEALDFDVDAATLARGHVELAFDGLDTLADVRLNGVLLLQADNMFRHWRVPAKAALRPGANRLLVTFHSPITRWQPWLQRQPYVLPGAYDSAFGDEPRGFNTSTYVRKAGYHYGWDWGPRFVTAGLWQPVRLESWSGPRLVDVNVRQRQVDAEVALVDVELEIDADADAAGPAHLHVDIAPPPREAGFARTGAALAHGTAPTPGDPATPVSGAGRPSEPPDDAAPPALDADVVLDPGQHVHRLSLRIPRPRRWFPYGHGPQAMYRFTATVTRQDRVVANAERRAGLRSVELRRDADQWGRGFAFVVNGIPIFAKGANMIPLDMFANRVTPERHRALLLAARDAHMNLLRLWGGGYYESDDLYDQADELGLLIWQDFMYGGAILPADAAFRAQARVEATEQVRRLRRHPSIVLWCGNNEVQADWESWDATLAFKARISPEERERLWTGNALLFGDVLRSVVAAEAGDVPYWATSPGNDLEGASNQEADGDYHLWSVWGGSAPVQSYLDHTPRFLSEFGLQSMPALSTLRTVLDPGDLRLDSTVLQSHQKFGIFAGHDVGDDRLLLYIRRDYGEPADFGAFVYLSQLMQADGIELAASHMRSQRPRAMGAMYWQLNDVWPGASWSGIDSAGRWKALHYRVRRFYADVAVTALRHEGRTKVTLLNDRAVPLDGVLTERVLRYDGQVLHSSERAVHLAPLSAALIADTDDAALLHGGDASATVVEEVLQVPGEPVSRSLVWFATPRTAALPVPNVHATFGHDGHGGYVVLRSSTVVRGLWMDFGSADITPDDNGFDLLPGETRHVPIADPPAAAVRRDGFVMRSAYGGGAPVRTR